MPEFEICRIYSSDVTERQLAEQKIRLQKKHIDQSISYTQRIQQAVLPAKNILEQTFINWKDDNNQIDDILVMGCKV